jgi:hypothetical protein
MLLASIIGKQVSSVEVAERDKDKSADCRFHEKCSEQWQP